MRFNVVPPPAPFAEATNQRPDDNVTFAYNLLSKYKTVIDYPNRTIYLLKYDDAH
ncbi:hypothetical protein [Hephaestia mangrovi]|uniref:hypothetical protein n=1 Tax=Hephaestia mangrovi TaxID=2873268 RepID=UPI001CA76391|nr:hypothetical protein [Hephaestia mangrovi]MBY8829853.1 hypothetical protein [Hephaestia mangrovi]